MLIWVRDREIDGYNMETNFSAKFTVDSKVEIQLDTSTVTVSKGDAELMARLILKVIKDEY